MEVARQQTGALHHHHHHQDRQERILFERILAAERQMKHGEGEPQISPPSVSDNDDEKRSSEDDDDEERASGVERVEFRERKVAYVETSLDDLIYSDHDGEASGQSEDEENERRLIERLKLENQQRQMHQLEQQQQQQQQREELARQQQKAAAQVICFHDSSQPNANASLRRQSSGAQQQRQPTADRATSESECADEPAPQVPVRRSSRQASLQQPVADNHQAAPVYSLHHRRLIGLQARGRPAQAPAERAGESEDEDREECEDDEDGLEESLLPPPPRLQAVGPGVLASASARPPLPPPPPPPPPAVDSSRRGKHPPPPPPPRTRSAQQAPKNIWSPSSSSLASSSLSSEPELELDPVPVATRQDEEEEEEEVAPCEATSPTGSEGDQRGWACMMQQQQELPISRPNKGPSEASRSNEEDEVETIVERHLQADAANSSDNKAGAENELLHRHHNNKRPDDSSERRDGATSIEASGASPSAADNGGTMARMPAAVAGNKSDGAIIELPLPPPPIEHQERGNFVLPKGNLRSFSISSPTNLTTSQRQQLTNASHQFSSAGTAPSAGLSTFVGGPSAGRSSRSPAGQMRSFSIAAPSERTRVPPGQRVELTTGACQPEQARREQTKRVELGGGGDESMQIAPERTLQPPQPQQQRTEELAGRAQQAARQDHTAVAAGTRTVTADRVAGPALEREQTKQNKDKKLGPTSIEREMAPAIERDPPLDLASDENLLNGQLNRRLETTTKQAYQGKQQTTFTKTQISTTTTTTTATTARKPQVEQNPEQHQPPGKEEWFRQMYKQMHRPVGAPVTAEKSLLDAVNQASQRGQQAADGSTPGCIKIKLKSPRSDHHQEPSYFSEEALERRSASPAFNGTKPGNICDYLPGHSSISQHERNLLLYHKLIDHINRVFSSVLVQQQEAPAVTSRSTNALASLHTAATGGQHQLSCRHQTGDDLRGRSHSMRRTSRTRRRSSSGGGGRAGTLKKRKQLAQSRSGPQTPAASTQSAHITNRWTGNQTTCSPAYHIRSTRLNDETTTTSGDEHERRCVFNRLLEGDDNQRRGYESDQDQSERAVDLNDDDDAQTDAGAGLARDPRKQYVAVQQGRDIPLKGLRKPAPQPNIYRDEMFDEKSINIHYKSPASRLLKMNTLNEFELNRIKKFYAQELASRRLQRSKSTRVNTSASGKSQRYQSAHQQRYDLLPALPVRPFRAADDSSQSTEPGGPIIDLKRYSHALTAKRKTSQRAQRAGARGDRFVAKFARAMYDFCAKNEGELSIKRGDLAETLEILEGDQWARVEDCQSGLQGLVPLSYLDYEIGCAVARRDVASSSASGHLGASAAGSRASSRMGGAESHLHASTADGAQHRLLAMSKGEPIALIRRLDGHLYEASNTRQATGLVWSNDLDIIRQPPGGVAPPVGASNYANPNFGDGDFSTDDDDDEDDGDEDGEYPDDEQDEDLARCLRSICRELGEGGAERGRPFASLSRARRQAPRCDHLEHRRRRTRSASGALNEQEDQHQQQRHQAHYRTQQFCTMSKRQRQQVAAASCQRAAQRPLCNCPTAECGQPASSAVVRSSSSPQIAPLLVAAHHQQQAASLPRFCRARYAYKARQRDELELTAGDVLVVVQECDDGWLIGHSYTTKQMGTFPGNFVEPI